MLAGDLQILHSHGVKVVFLTLGELGSIVSSSCGESGKTRYAHVKAERVNNTSTYSVVGAGDAFVAGVVFKLASSSKVKFNFKENVDAAAFGSKVDALCVETTKNPRRHECFSNSSCLDHCREALRPSTIDDCRVPCPAVGCCANLGGLAIACAGVFDEEPDSGGSIAMVVCGFLGAGAMAMLVKMVGETFLDWKFGRCSDA